MNIIKNTKLRQETCERYQNLPKEEKEKRQKKQKTEIKIFLKKKKKKRQYHCEQNKNLSEEKNIYKVEQMRDYYLAHKKYFELFFRVI